MQQVVLKTFFILTILNGVKWLKLQSKINFSRRLSIHLQKLQWKLTLKISVELWEKSKLWMSQCQEHIFKSESINFLIINQIGIAIFFSSIFPSGDYQINVTGIDNFDDFMFKFTFIHSLIRKWEWNKIKCWHVQVNDKFYSVVIKWLLIYVSNMTNENWM